jgi:hypothetical protein
MAGRKAGEGYWLDVRAFDADDLEQWLEESPAVALSFGDELGLIGPGVETLARSWQAWASQSNPTLTPGALFSAREPLLQKLVLELRNAIASARSPITLRGDSVAEAVAFACATILYEGSADNAVVITHIDGWRYVEKNPQLSIAVAGIPEIAARAVQRNGLAVVGPLALGDLGGSFDRDNDPEFRLERPDHRAFVEALIKLGIEKSDADRLATLAPPPDPQPTFLGRPASSSATYVKFPSVTSSRFVSFRRIAHAST